LYSIKSKECGLLDHWSRNSKVETNSMCTILKSHIDTQSMVIIKTKSPFSKLNSTTPIISRSVRTCCIKKFF
jgi:hypothetical protein